MSSDETSEEAANDEEEVFFPSNKLPGKIIISVGTYDGVLAGWELDSTSSSSAAKTRNKFKIRFASPVHDGSVRSLAMAHSGADATKSSLAGPLLLSCGYDEVLYSHDFAKNLTSSAAVRTPADFGTPVCASFAPPLPAYRISSGCPLPISTHCILGFDGGKLVIYKKRDWVVQHVLAGHEGGVSSLAVHPSGKLALTGGTCDGKIKLWDLTKGRLAFVNKVQPAKTAVQGRTRYDAVVRLVWSPDEAANAYGFAYGSHITVRHVASGKDLLDVELPSRVNDLCFLHGADGHFVAVACNDGSLPVLAVQQVDAEESDERRAIMAIEPVDGPVAGEERFKCICNVFGHYVATANSAGVVSLMNLQGAVNMIMSGSGEQESGDESPVNSDTDEDDEELENKSLGEKELAVDIIDAVRLGTGARITCLSAWSSIDPQEVDASHDNDSREEEIEVAKPVKVVEQTNTQNIKRKRDDRNVNDVVLDEKDIEKARSLVTKAKKIQKRKDRKKKKQRADK